MTDKIVKLRRTISWTFEVHPGWYEPDTTPEEMAVFEAELDVELSLDFGISQPDFSCTVTVEPEFCPDYYAGKKTGQCGYWRVPCANEKCKCYFVPLVEMEGVKEVTHD